MLGSQESLVSQTHGGVVFWVFTVFSNFKPLLQPLKKQSIKNSVNLLFTKQILLVFILKKNFWSNPPVSRTPVSRFKTWITLGKCLKIPNGFVKCMPRRSCLMKKGAKISCYSPFNRICLPFDQPLVKARDCALSKVIHSYKSLTEVTYFSK